MSDTPLDALARRVEEMPFFFGHTLATYRDRRGLRDADLCALLGCGAEVLRDLKLCRAPDPETADLDALARELGLDPGRLAAILAPVEHRS